MLNKYTNLINALAIIVSLHNMIFSLAEQYSRSKLDLEDDAQIDDIRIQEDLYKLVQLRQLLY